MSNTPNSRDRHAAPDIHRTLPHSLEVEQGMLGSMLISPADVIGEYVQAGVTAAWFYQPAHATIYAILVECWNAQKPADVIILTQILRDRNQLDAVGGPAFVTHLFTFMPTAANAGYYLEHGREDYRRREIISTCAQYAAWAYESPGEGSVDLLQDAFEAEVLRLPRTGNVNASSDDPNAGTLAALDELEAVYAGKREVVGIKLGLAPLDKMLGGATAGQMIVVAARPSVGKSAFALNIAESVAVERGLAVGMFSLEMTQGQQRRRLILSRARVNMAMVRERLTTEAEFARMGMAGQKIATAPFYIDDARGLSIAELRARARRWHQRHVLELLIVDYLQLVRSGSQQAQRSREREVAEVSEGLKSLAGELRIPIIALCQLNRDSDKHKRKPRLSDLRESGSLEQDADVVLLLHREEMQAENDEERAEFSGEAELIVAKQREGPLGPISLTFRKEFTRFEERA